MLTGSRVTHKPLPQGMILPWPPRVTRANFAAGQFVDAQRLLLALSVAFQTMSKSHLAEQ